MLNSNISLLSRVKFGQVMFDNGLVALEPLGWLGLLQLKLTGVVLISSRDRGGGRKEGVRSKGIRANMATGETVELRKVGDLKGSNQYSRTSLASQCRSDSACPFTDGQVGAWISIIFRAINF